MYIVQISLSALSSYFSISSILDIVLCNVILSLVPQRFLNEYNLPNSHINADAPVQVQVPLKVSTTSTVSMPTTKFERYKALSVTCQELCNVGCLSGGTSYETKADSIKQLIKYWNDGIEYSILPLNTSGSTHQTIEPPTPPEMERQLPPLSSPAIIDVDIPASTCDVSAISYPQSEPPVTHSLQSQQILQDLRSTLKEPKTPKVRGRPRGATQTVIGLKRKCAPVPMKTAKLTRIQKIRDDICCLCNAQDPPKQLSSDEIIKWVSCGICTRWYHLVCLNPNDLNKENFECHYCI
jgi:hypothetical protein